ncbi:MAG TPA: error-prone DNA polymerase [Polyangiaceae bacterium]|jgi:error-prone DNA polymerase
MAAAPPTAPPAPPTAPEPRAPSREPGAPFVELFARTNFSFLRGGSHPRAVLAAAAQHGYDCVGVADCDGLYGMVRALEAADEAGVRLVTGCEVALDGDALPFVWLHVADAAGYTNLCRILTESHERHPKGQPRRADEGVPRNQFAGIPLDRVCACAAGLWCTVPPIAGARLDALKAAFGERLSVAVWRHFDGEDDARLAAAEALASGAAVPVCATNRVLFAYANDKPLFDVLHCIREGVPLDEAGRALLPNAEAHLRSPAAMARAFAHRPAWLARSRAIADACRFSLRELHYKFPCELEAPAFPGETADQALRRLTFEGALRHWPAGPPPAVAAQLEKELALVAAIDVAPYFLSVQTVVEMARKRDILCQGRGSAANSAVCYCLGVTAVDPTRSNLLFERFLSAERREPPDIDVDFEHERREEVIQEIFRRYGRDRAAMVSEVISYRGKSALREAGKVFGLSLEQVDRLGALVSWWDKLDQIDAPRMRACGFDPGDGRVRQVLAMAHALQGTPRHLSIHVGGFVLSAEPLVHVAPVEPATMKDRWVIPWDKDDLDTLRFYKIDVLGLGMLTAIRKALAMVAEGTARGDAATDTAIDRLARIPPEDPTVYDALCKADTVGVFQIESRAQMAMLPRLRPRRFYDLVVEVAIVRPGPIQGGMVHPYLRRRSGEEPATMPHASLEPILGRTLGVPLFQEQVMQLAIVGAGYTGGEADQLRRDMAAWRRSGRLARHKEKLLAGFEEKGIERAFGERLYKSIEGFGEYGFPESHAASFALLVYASSWLKVHHPAAFAAALVNSQPMGFYSPGSIVKDAERHGVEVLPARVDASDWDCTLEGAMPDVALRLGLRLVRGLGEDAGKRIETARRARSFASVEDMVARAALDKRELEALAHAGALVGFGLARREAMWKVRAPREGPLVAGAAGAESKSGSLFAGVELGDAMPALPAMSRAEQLVLDYETTGVSVGDHAMKVVRPRLPRGFKSSRDLETTPHGARVSTAGLVICRQRPGTASGVVFVTMEDEHGFVNLILWAQNFERWRHVATTSSMLVAHGKVEREGDVVYVIPDRLEKLALLEAPAMSRDFH